MTWRRHCERSEAIHPVAKKGWIAASLTLLAMTLLQLQTHLHALAAHCARAVENLPPLERKEGAGNAGCALHPRSRVQAVQKNAHEHTGSAETLRHSPRNGFTVYGALSPATNSSCHRHRRIKGCLGPVRPTRLRRLDTSNGCQNHTLLPYAATRLCQPPSSEVGLRRVKRLRRAKASFVWRAMIAHGRSALRSPFAPDAAASTASHPNVCDDGQRPSWRDETAEVILLIFPTA
jgi:hypothetical protein